MGILGSDKGSIKPTDVGSSASQNTAVGSGSRPTKSSIDIPTSAPDDPRTLGRAPQGWLK